MKDNKMVKTTHGNGGFGYLLGLVGAAVYYIQQASGFGEVLVALLKALVWPALLVYDVLKFIAG